MIKEKGKGGEKEDKLYKQCDLGGLEVLAEQYGCLKQRERQLLLLSRYFRYVE